jgi:hypothetical protein
MVPAAVCFATSSATERQSADDAFRKYRRLFQSLFLDRFLVILCIFTFIGAICIFNSETTAGPTLSREYIRHIAE